MPVFLLLLTAVAASLALRVREKSRAQKYEVPEHAQSSPLSQALQELVSTAGGIYLSLVLLTAFLQIDMSKKTLISGKEIDTLAFIALALAVAQPFLLRFYRWFKGVL
ncbi:MAG: hypothetical protein KGZ57_08215 [Dethiobacter sp.]|nr:hypothetical protein [Dethiobacter sp.]